MRGMSEWPLWARGSVAGVLFGGLMFGWQVFSGERPTSPVALSALALTIPYALAMTLVIARQQRRLDPPDGPPLTPEERGRAIRAVRRGEPPADPRVAAAALAVTRTQLGQRHAPAVLGILFGGLALIAAALAVWSEPGWWMAAALVTLAAVVTVWQSRVQLRRATTYQRLAADQPTAQPAGRPGDGASG
ncbi:hypothetical protein [Plantactinospora sp. GCM10030261]|uniref:hypothetical protein n=1 Tax=Plantactinospora sp. GCM10030261 TaxID=3273420 RepID=UPI0036237CEC